MSDELKNKPESFWRERLSEDEFAVCRQKGTERAFTGEYYNEKSPGKYLCRCCGEPLFDSEAKYDSGSGWPSFFEPVTDEVIEEHADHSHGMTRIEILCQKCGSHLGHVFPDGPKPTGMRYCVNSLSLKLNKGSNKEPNEG